MIDIGTAVSIGSSLIGGLGGGKKGGEQKTPYQNLPPMLRQLLEEVYFPDMKAEYERPFEPMPTVRAANPMDDPFASQALWQYQNQNDMAALQKMMGGQQGDPQADQMEQLRHEMLGRQFLSDARNGNIELLGKGWFQNGSVNDGILNDPGRLAKLGKLAASRPGMSGQKPAADQWNNWWRDLTTVTRGA